MSLTLATFVIVCCAFETISAEVSEFPEEKVNALYFCTRDQDTRNDSRDYCTLLLKCLIHCEVKPCPFSKAIDPEELEKSNKLFATCSGEILPEEDWPLLKTNTPKKRETSAEEQRQDPQMTKLLTVLSKWGEDPVCHKNIDGLYPDYKNCHKYYYCQQGVLRQMHCPGRERFNKLTKHCEPGRSNVCQTKKISIKNSRKQNRAKTKARRKTEVKETNSELVKAVYFCNRNHNAPINDPDYCRLFHQCLVYCDKITCPLLDNLNPEFFQYLVTRFYSPHDMKSKTLPTSYHRFADVTNETFFKRIEKTKLLYDSCREKILPDVDWNLFPTCTTETSEIVGGSTSPQTPTLQAEEGYLYYCTNKKRGGLLENPENCRRLIECVKNCKKSKKCQHQQPFNFERLETAKKLFKICTEKVTESEETKTTLAPKPPPTSRPLKPSTTTKATTTTTESLQSLYDKGGKYIYFCTSKHDELAATIDNCQRLFKCIVSCQNYKQCFITRLFDPKQLTKALQLYDECTILPPEGQATKQPKVTTTPKKNTSPRYEGQDRAERICNRDIITRTEDLKHCDKYFMCTDRGVELMTCPEGQLFDDLRFKCAPKKNVYCNGRNRP